MKNKTYPLTVKSIHGKVSTIEIEEKKGVYFLKGQSKRGRKRELISATNIFKGIKDNEILLNLLRLNHYLKLELKLKPSGITIPLLLEITSLYLEIPKIRKVDSKTSKVRYEHARATYNFAYTIRYLSS